ncbi:hypothetical protein BRC68_09215 [Halobacteriales archaeon QH_6_64_20]|nr:MAG: hypothetical protein BRC68_09215 [Halobacteriales archaeon QH_6_64_20]
MDGSKTTRRAFVTGSVTGFVGVLAGCASPATIASEETRTERRTYGVDSGTRTRFMSELPVGADHRGSQLMRSSFGRGAQRSGFLSTDPTATRGHVGSVIAVRAVRSC